MKLRHWLLVLLMKYLLTCTLGVAFMTTATYSDRGKFLKFLLFMDKIRVL